jgi:hypothetical protein
MSDKRKKYSPEFRPKAAEILVVLEGEEFYF